MNNIDKIMKALKQAFPGHRVENVFYVERNEEAIFFDGTLIGRFVEEFCEHDFDEIEIKIKAPLKNIKDFVDHANSYGIIRGAVERGLKEWEEG